MEKRKSSINTVCYDAPTVSARFIHGSITIYDDSATIHHGGATNAHNASKIRYHMVLVGFKPVVSRHSYS